MKTQNRFFDKLIILAFLVLGLACSKDDSEGPGPDPGSEASTFDEVIALGADFEAFPQTRDQKIITEEDPKNEDFEREEEGEEVKERFVCTKRRVSITDGNDEFPLFNPNSAIIFPGNLLQGRTLDDATPESIPLKRGGGTISYNIIDGNLNSSSEVTEVKLSSIRDAQNNIIFGSVADNDYKVPANFNLTVQEVQSKEELALKLGVKFKTFNAKVSGSFSVNSSREMNSVLVKLTQQFYTMDFDIPTSSDEFFHESVTPEELKQYVQADNPAAFISSVTYGRTFYMLFESTSSSQEMKAKLEVGYKTIGAAGEGSVEFESFNSLKNLSLQVIAYGGDSAETLDAVGNFRDNNSIGEFLSKIGKSSDIRTGLPLSYIANSVERRSQVVGSKLATEYDVVECELRGILPPGLYSDLLDLFDDGIGAMVNVKDSDVLIFNKAGTNYAWFNGNLGRILGDSGPKIYDINDPDAPLGDVGLEDIGAGAVSKDLSSPFPTGKQIYIYSNDGKSAQILNLENSKIPDNALPDGMIGKFAENGQIFAVNQLYGDAGNFIIGTNGIEATVRVGATRQALFGKPGNRYQVYDGAVGSNGSFEDPEDTDSWLGDSESIEKNGALFERVNAATRFTLSGNSRRYLFVNEEGTKIMEWFSSAAQGEDRFEGPWVIN